MSDTKGKEIEFKYRADHLVPAQMAAFCKELGPHEYLAASGWDYFYADVRNPGSFARHRVSCDGAFNQLTFKRKLVEKNNFIRTEHNIDLAVGSSQELIASFCSEFGYTFNTAIFKNVFVYKYPKHVFSYYICYDEAMKELGRFIEIEMSETYAWSTAEQAMTELIDLENGAKEILGISAQARVKKSLFEQFKR